MKRVAVLGANGQLGQTLKSLVGQETGSYDFYSKKDVDITNRESLNTLFKEKTFDYCVNCAAYTNVELAEQDIEGAFSINAKGAKNVAEACESQKIKLIHISTDYVFDGKKREPYKKNDKTNPINEYGKSKLEGERFIKEITQEYYIIRTSWLYSLFGKNFLKTIINRVENDKKLNITTAETGTPTSCIDLAEFINFIVMSDNIPYGTYNFSAKGNTSWYGFAREIIKHTYPNKLQNIAPSNSYPTKADRPKYSVLDISGTEKIYKALNQWQDSIKILLGTIKT